MIRPPVALVALPGTIVQKAGARLVVVSKWYGYPRVVANVRVTEPPELTVIPRSELVSMNPSPEIPKELVPLVASDRAFKLPP